MILFACDELLLLEAGDDLLGVLLVVTIVAGDDLLGVLLVVTIVVESENFFLRDDKNCIVFGTVVDLTVGCWCLSF